MSDKNLENFFEEFKLLRKSKKLSIEDVSKATKLQPEYITAIESGNFSIMSNVYNRLFIKSYCEYLNMDADKTLRLYEEYISGKSKKKTSDETPKFIDQKSKDKNDKILDIDPQESDIQTIDSKQIMVLSGVIIIVLISWILLAKASNTTHKNHKIKFDNTKLEWTYFENLNMIDSQYVKLKKINKKNVFQYEYLDIKNKILITNSSGLNVVNKIINENDQDENSVSGDVEFGLLTGNLKFSINNQKIDFKYPEKTIIGFLDIKEKTLLLKYYQ